MSLFYLFFCFSLQHSSGNVAEENELGFLLYGVDSPTQARKITILFYFSFILVLQLFVFVFTFPFSLSTFVIGRS